MGAPVAKVPQRVRVTAAPPRVTRDKPPVKEFKFDLLPGANVDPKDKFDVEFQIFAQANLRTKNGRAGRVGMDVVLDSRKTLLTLEGDFDPDGFPADQTFSATETIVVTVSKINKTYTITTKARGGTGFDKKTVFDIQLLFVKVS